MRYLLHIACEISNIVEAIKKFFEDKPAREYSKGQILLYQAENTDSIFFIQSGFVKMYDINSNGEEKLLLVLGPGDTYPIVWTFRESEKLLYFYESMSDVSISVAHRREFTAEVDISHEFTKSLLRYFVERIKDLSLRLECIGASNAKYKVAQVVGYLLEKHPGQKKGNYQLLAVQTTHQIIASMAGISRETASVTIKEFEDAGIVSQELEQLGVNHKKLQKFLSSE